MQTLIEKVVYAKQLWAMTFADHTSTRQLGMPDDAFFVRILAQFSVAEYEYAIGRTAQKFPFKRPARPPYVTLDDLLRYTGGILNNERIAQQRREEVSANTTGEQQNVA
jgi:hypothetical protein